MTHIYLKLMLLFLISLLLNTACNDAAPASDTKKTAEVAKELPVKNEVYGIARIEPENDIVTLNAGTTGEILEVYIKDNDEISAGQKLVRLDRSLEEAQLQRAKSKLPAQEAAENVAKENRLEVTLELEKAQKDLTLARDLLEGQAGTRQQVDDLVAKVDQLKQQRASRQASLEEVLAQREAIEAEIQYYRTVLADKSVVAPLSGKVLQVLVHPGEFLNNSTGVIEYAPEGAVIANAEIDELFADKVKQGQKAAIYSQMTGEEIARGTVIYAADYLKQKSLFKNQSTELEDRRIREVKVKLEEGDFPLYGSRVDCRIYIK